MSELTFAAISLDGRPEHTWQCPEGAMRQTSVTTPIVSQVPRSGQGATRPTRHDPGDRYRLRSNISQQANGKARIDDRHIPR